MNRFLFLLSILCITSIFAAPLRVRMQVVPTAISEPGGSALLFARRLAALSMIESGDNDRAIGSAGEVSRYQIMPEIFAQYFFVVKPPPDIAASRLKAGARNPFIARNIATAIMRDRSKAFEARYHRDPSDFEFYILWARPACLLGPGITHAGRRLLDRAHRFANLCSRKP